MKIEELKKLVDNGKIFNVTFKKKDGTIRVMSCRMDVKKYLKGGEMPYNPIAKGLLPVFEIGKGYKVVAADTIIQLKANGEVFNFA
jgi:hypothetical protein